MSLKQNKLQKKFLIHVHVVYQCYFIVILDKRLEKFMKSLDTFL